MLDACRKVSNPFSLPWPRCHECHEKPPPLSAHCIASKPSRTASQPTVNIILASIVGRLFTTPTLNGC